LIVVLFFVQGMTVARPVFFEFPDDETTLDIDKQWLLGPALYITPVLEQSSSLSHHTD
jgi:alpha-glucosidase (family GH31 glycosyl hydrolase)